MYKWTDDQELLKKKKSFIPIYFHKDDLNENSCRALCEELA